MEDSQIVILSTITLSVILAGGFVIAWYANHKLFSIQRCEYLLYYAGYLLIVNVTRTTLVFFGLNEHSAVKFGLDCLAVILIYLAAEDWAESPAFWQRALVLPAIVSSMAHNLTGYRAWALAYALSFIIIMALTVYRIIQLRTPWPIIWSMVLGFTLWTAVNILFPHPRGAGVFAFGMVIKVIMFGSVILAHYERQHRKMWGAAMVRKLAIDAISGQVGQDGLNGRGFAELCGYPAPH